MVSPASAAALKPFVFDPNNLPLFNIMQGRMSDIFSRSPDNSEATSGAREAAGQLREKIKLIKNNIDHIAGIADEELKNTGVITCKISEYANLIKEEISCFLERIIERYESVEKFSNSDKKDDGKTIKNLSADILTLRGKVNELLEKLRKSENEEGYVMV